MDILLSERLQKNRISVRFISTEYLSNDDNHNKLRCKTSLQFRKRGAHQKHIINYPETEYERGNLFKHFRSILNSLEMKELTLSAIKYTWN
jgi:hypothetical protein